MSDPASRSSDAGVAYPGSLREKEEALVRIRRGMDAGTELERESLVGVGLSGGGIRSATFCLGLFQGLAKLKLLECVDFLSTVSGGGYFGAFYGRLFNRPQITDLDDVRALLRPDLAQSVPDDRLSRGRVFRFLRENGRYLAPSGAGDLILGGAVILRNWVSVQVVLFAFVLMLFQLPQLLRAGVHVSVDDARWDAFERLLAQTMPFGERFLWWSPYVVVAAAIFVLAVVPLGWAYWMIRDRSPQSATRGKWHGGNRIPASVDPRIGLVVATALAGIGAWQWRASHGALVVLGSLATAGVIALLIQGWIRGNHRPHLVAAARRRLSGMFAGALTVFAVVVAFVLVDTLGQTLYVLWLAPDETVSAWLAGLFGVLAAFGAGARRIAVFAGARGGARAKVPLPVAAWIAAALLFLIVLTVADALSQGMAWEFKTPPHAPEALTGASVVNGCNEGGPRDNLTTPALALLALAVVSWLFGRSWPFLNRSSLHALYSARLTRAYLGASNPCRVDPKRARSWEPCKAGGAKGDGDAVTITDVIEGDDVSLEDYYGLSSDTPPDCVPFPKGAPLHIINVTVNETIDGQSQIQRLDRKGFGLAVGPAGFSAGIRHHAVREEGGGWDLYPSGSGEDQFRVFEQWGEGHTGEELQLGTWSGISGAAFSTGSGSSTYFGLSLLAGFFNVRTGYWWDSHVSPKARLGGRAARGTRIGQALAASFPVQAYLLDEFLSSFHGSGRRWWNLSDGGHFENMGGYELIRRRLPLIIVVDAEADPDYRFEGLSDLILKARLDFGAEIKFLDSDQLDGLLGDELAPYFGTLDMLRRGPWRKDTVPEIHAAGAQPSSRVAGWRKRRELASSDRARHSLAHAAIARVTYASEPDWCSCLVYVKATMCGDESADLVHYHAEHEDFPQQTTADQFFDEAQWESYRKLGQVIAERVFAKKLAPFESVHGGLRTGTSP